MSEIAMGIINARRGFAVRVAAGQYDNAVTIVYPHDSERFSGKRLDISGLPLSMGASAINELLDGWRTYPEYTFRQTNRTWIVRTATEPHVTKIHND